MQYLYLFITLWLTISPPHYHQLYLDPEQASHVYVLENPEQTNLRNFYLYVHSGNLEIHAVTAKLKEGASIYFAVGKNFIKDQYTPNFRVHGQEIQSLKVDYDIKLGSPKVHLELVGGEN